MTNYVLWEYVFILIYLYSTVISVLLLWMIIKLFLIELTSFEPILDVVQLDVWDECFIYCSRLSLTYTCCESWSWFLHLAALPNGCPPIIRLNIFPWVQIFYIAALFVSNSFSFNVKSIVIYYVWNAKLNLFIYSCAMVTEMDVLRVATFYPHLHCTCRPTQMWVCGQDLAWNKTCHWWSPQ